MRVVMLEPLGVSEDKLMSLARPLLGRGHRLEPCKDRIESEEERIERASGADVLIIANSPLPARVIRSAPNLKMISVAFTGVDHVDIGACSERGIVVCNARGYSTHSVAELTFGLIFSVLRKITACDAAAREGRTGEGLVGFELYGKTVGIVGTGAIGLRVAELAKAFGCRLLGYSRTRRKEALEMGLKYVSLEELMSESDVLCLHVPLTEETRLLINKERIALMKPSAVLINAARGGVVDSHALAEALNEGRIAGAGIDVFEAEPPLPQDHPLLHARNTVLTPHVAFATAESLLRRADIAFGNIIAWLDGKPRNLITGQ